MSPLPDIVPDLCDAIVLQLHFLEHVPAFPQKIAATDDNSALREEMRALEPEEENAQPRTLHWSPWVFLAKSGLGTTPTVGTFPFGRPFSAPRLVNLSLSSLPSLPTLTPVHL